MSLPLFEKAVIAGLPIAVLSHEATTDVLVGAAKAHQAGQMPYYSTSANGEIIARAYQDPQFMALLCEADMINADGQPLVLASQWLGRKPLPERVTTTDLFHHIARRIEGTDLSFYLFGANAQENSLCLANLKTQYPHLKFAGAHHGYVKGEVLENLIAEINAAAPSFLWVSLGAPLEQEFVSRYKAKLTNVGVIKTSGGLFNYISGTRSRAPLWMQKYSLEWLYRLYLEPKRLGWRYLSTNPIAAWHLLTKTH
jgi:N-acetylglucosaminyldiphosphoundecaprenol N-acetyl-beta-D-mannosaminyltransferase